MKKFIAFLFLLSSTCLADGETFVGYGVGILNDANYFVGQNKYAELGHRSFLLNGIYWQYKGGFWGEGSPDSSRKSSAWASTGLGLEVSLQPVELRSGWSLAAISTPDSQLGSNFQFNGELYAGLRDKHGNGIGVQYEHLSCGSLCSPNHGRDFLILQLSIKR